MSKCLTFSPNYSLLYYTLLCEKSKQIFSLFIVADLMQQKTNTFILVLDVILYLKKNSQTDLIIFNEFCEHWFTDRVKLRQTVTIKCLLLKHGTTNSTVSILQSHQNKHPAKHVFFGKLWALMYSKCFKYTHARTHTHKNPIQNLNTLQRTTISHKIQQRNNIITSNPNWVFVALFCVYLKCQPGNVRKVWQNTSLYFQGTGVKRSNAWKQGGGEHL